MVTKKSRRVYAVLAVKKYNTKELSSTTSEQSSDKARNKSWSSSKYSEENADTESTEGQDEVKNDCESDDGLASVLSSSSEDLKEKEADKSKDNMQDEKDISIMEIRKKKRKIQRPKKRILKLAEPKPLPREVVMDLKFEPFKVERKALYYRASKRINQLAKPIIRKPENVREEDVFKVKRASLKAKCSERIKQLATAKRVEYPEPLPQRKFYSLSTAVHVLGKGKMNIKRKSKNIMKKYEGTLESPTVIVRSKKKERKIGKVGEEEWRMMDRGVFSKTEVAKTKKGKFRNKINNETREHP